MPSWMRALFSKKSKRGERVASINDGQANVGGLSRGFTQAVRSDESNNQSLSALASAPTLTPSSEYFMPTEHNIRAEKHASPAPSPAPSQPSIPHQFEQEKQGLFILYPTPELSTIPLAICAEYVMSFLYLSCESPLAKQRQASSQSTG